MDVNGVEANEDREPFTIGTGSLPVLLLHGLTGSPWDLRPIGEDLASRGYCVHAPMLAGHRSLSALEKTGWADWYDSAERACLEMSMAFEAPIIVAGFSMGALLALRLAAVRPHDVRAVVSMSIPLELPRWRQLAIHALNSARQTPALKEIVGHYPKADGVDVRRRSVAHASPSLDHFPYSSLVNLINLQRDVRHRIEHIEQPVLLMHGRHDHSAPPEHSARVARHLKSPRVRQVYLPRSFHLIGRDVEMEAVQEEIAAFVNEQYAHDVSSQRISDIKAA